MTTLIEYAPFIAILFIAACAICYLAGQVRERKAAYWRGHRDGTREERGRTNARMMNAKLTTFHDGVKLGRWSAN